MLFRRRKFPDQDLSIDFMIYSLYLQGKLIEVRYSFETLDREFLRQEPFESLTRLSPHAIVN